MDFAVLKKKISSYKTPTGKVTKVPDELIMEILHVWEQWTGPALGFYSEIGVSANKMAGIIGRGKKLKREGHFPEADFKEIRIDSSTGQVQELGPCSGIELIWNGGKVIRFSQVDLLLDFLKKAA